MELPVCGTDRYIYNYMGYMPDMVLGSFQRHFSKGQFPKWQLSKCAISYLATSHRLEYAFSWDSRPITNIPITKRPMEQNSNTQLQNAQCYKTPNVTKRSIAKHPTLQNVQLFVCEKRTVMDFSVCVRLIVLCVFLLITYLRLKDKVRIIFDCSDHNTVYILQHGIFSTT